MAYLFSPGKRGMLVIACFRLLASGGGTVQRPFGTIRNRLQTGGATNGLGGADGHSVFKVWASLSGAALYKGRREGPL